MKAIIPVFLALIISITCSCDILNKTTDYTFEGKAQKGPFQSGSVVSLYELDKELHQTGNTFTSTISADDGKFELDNVGLKSNIVLLSAEGYYFSELYGTSSPAPLTLQAICDLDITETANVNVLTHFIKGRVETLVGEGLSFFNANEQAKSEALIFLGIEESVEKDFSIMDISENETQDAILLAFSLALQRYTLKSNEKANLTAELSELLNHLALDFSSNGQINDQETIDTLLFNISRLNLLDIRDHLEEKYSNLGEASVIPNFEKYIAGLQEKYSSHLYTHFLYPASASPEPVDAPDALVQNILAPGDSVFKPATPYSLAAIVPLNSSLAIKFIGGGFSIGMYQNGWEVINEYPSGFTLNSQRQNEIISMLIELNDTGNARIEYYENNSEIPVYSKNISWNYTQDFSE